MSIQVTVNGVNYLVPNPGDRGWGQQLTNLFTQLANPNAVFQRDTSSFALKSDVDFGSSYGIKLAYLTSKGTNTATAGAIRLSNTDLIEWRNAANTSNLTLGVNASDQLVFDGSAMKLSNTSPILLFNETDQGTDSKNYAIHATAGTLTFRLANDAGTLGTNALQFSRATGAVTTLTFGNATDNPSYVFLGTGLESHDTTAIFRGSVVTGVSNPGISIGEFGATGRARQVFIDTTGAANTKAWDWITSTSGTHLSLNTRDDTILNGSTVLDITRSGTAVTSLVFGNINDYPSYTFYGLFGQSQSLNGATNNVFTNSNTGGGTSVSIGASNGADTIYLGMRGTSYLGTTWTGGPTGTAAFLGTASGLPITIATSSVERIRIAAAGNVTINAPSSGIPLTTTAVANNYASYFVGSSTSGQSFGPLIDAGTTSADYAYRVRTQAGSDLTGVRGNGGAYFNTYNAPNGLVISNTFTGGAIGLDIQVSSTGSPIGVRLEDTVHTFDIYPSGSIGTRSNHSLTLLAGNHAGLTQDTVGQVSIPAPTSGIALTLVTGPSGALMINSSASNADSYAKLGKNSTVYAYTGVAGATNGMIQGSAANDLCIRGENVNVRISGNAGTSSGFAVGPTNLVYLAGATTTASAANCFLDGANSNQVYRSTSSIRYKSDVEDVQSDYIKATRNLRPVWYRSTAEHDRKEWSWYGLIAEEVAEIDPRLVHWIKDAEGKLIPDAVQYERLSVLLLSRVKWLEDELIALKQKVAA